MTKKTKLTTAQVESRLNGFDFSQLPKPGKNKGSRGQILEEALGIDNGNSLTDMSDGELKTFTIGQSIAMTSLGHCLPEIIDKSLAFRESKLFAKLKQVIFVGYNRDGNFSNWKTVNESTFGEYYRKFAEDYDFISGKIRTEYENRRELHTITGPNKLLQIRTKARKKKDGSYTPLDYNGVYLKNKYMSFFLLAKFGKEVLKKNT
jgi:hypothetical protein